MFFIILFCYGRSKLLLLAVLIDEEVKRCLSLKNKSVKIRLNLHEFSQMRAGPPTKLLPLF